MTYFRDLKSYTDKELLTELLRRHGIDPSDTLVYPGQDSYFSGSPVGFVLKNEWISPEDKTLRKGGVVRIVVQSESTEHCAGVCLIKAVPKEVR